MVQSRIIICGGRHFDSYENLESVVDGVISSLNLSNEEVEIVSGHCAGTDQLGERYAEMHGMKCALFPAEWKKYGRAAGPVRNSKMIDYAAESGKPVVVAFVSPKSKGTLDTVRKAEKRGFKVVVTRYE
jgi:hypothetical protein